MTEVTPKQTQHAGGSPLGRRIGSALYWTVLLYVVAAALYSIPHQVFGFDRRPSNVSVSCRVALSAQRTALLDLAAEVTHAGRGIDDDAEHVLARWDEQQDSIAPACSDPQDRSAHALLSRLRYSLEATLIRFRHSEAHLLLQLEALLGPVDMPPPTRPTGPQP